MSARLLLRLIVAAVAALACSTTHAQIFRAYVASDGSDANPCTLSLPCRLLPAALAAVANGGEIWMLDSANYNSGTVTIGKSVTILAIPGAVGSVVALGGPAIAVNDSLLEIGLRNLVITQFPGGGATHGVVMTGNSAITLESSLLVNLPNQGIVVEAGSLKVINSTMRNIAGNAIRLRSSTSAHVNGSRILRSGGGVELLSGEGGPASAWVSDSLIADIGSHGISAGTFSFAGSTASVVVTRSVIQSTNLALQALTIPPGGPASISLDASSITGNVSAWSISGNSLIRSFGNNHFDMNGANEGVPTLAPLQ